MTSIDLTDDELRELAEWGNDSISKKAQAVLSAQYPEGTLARVHGLDEDDSDGWVTFAEFHDGEWQYANGIGSWELKNEVTWVEVIPTLRADCVALPVQLFAFWEPEEWVRRAETVSTVQARLLLAIADALSKPAVGSQVDA